MEGLEKKPTREVHLRDYINVILRRKWAVISLFVVVVVTVMVSTFSTEPIYRATCQVLIERANPQVLQFQELLSVDARWGFDYYQTQYEMLKSKLLAQRAIEELGLADLPEFNPESKKWSFSPQRALGTVLGGIKALFSSSGLSGCLAGTPRSVDWGKGGRVSIGGLEF